MNGRDHSYLTTLAQQLGDQMAERGLILATAESCTGGWIAKCITDVAGSSSWFERGFVTYHNQAKVEMLGVSSETLLQQGAVSEAVVREMLAGALANSRADRVVAVTGIAGPGGGSVDKPLGTVWLGWAERGGDMLVECRRFSGDREAVRAQSVERALSGLLQDLG